MPQKINFIKEDVDIRFFKNKEKVRTWVKAVIQEHNARPIEINYIFCSDDYLLEVNKNYLDHDYYTDIITFDNSESPDEIEADIFVSIDRIKENAITMNETFEREFHRVLIHGILHLLGYKDKTEEEAALMRRKEDACLMLLQM